MREKLIEVLGALKNIPRTGWVQRGVPPAIAETISSHLHEASVLCLELGTELASMGVISVEDAYKAVMITLIHDIGEGLTGDLNRFVSNEIGDLKERVEEKAIRSIGSSSIEQLYREYRERLTASSILAHMCDKLSTYIQAGRYTALGYNVEEIAETSLEEIRRLAGELCRDNERCASLIEGYIKGPH